MTSIKSSVSLVSRKTQSGSPSAYSTSFLEERTTSAKQAKEVTVTVTVTMTVTVTVTVMVMVTVPKGAKGRRKMVTHLLISVGIY